MALSASFDTVFSRRMQRKHYTLDVFRAVASFVEESNLRKGDTVDRPYRSDFIVDDYTRGSAITAQTISDTSEQLTVQTAKVIMFYVDDFDKLQHQYNVQAEYANDAAVKISNAIDGAVLAEIANATSTVDDGSLGGTSGNGFTLSVTNISRVFAIADRKLTALNIAQGDRKAVISPQFREVLLEYLAGRESAMGDATGVNGHVGRYYNFDLHMSNALYSSNVVGLATDITATDILTINGVVFTFVTNIGTTAGNVLLGADVAASRVNLAALLNAPGTTTATGVALSTADQALLKGIVATDDTSAKTVSLAVTGRSFISVSSSLTDGTDGWDATKSVQSNIFMRKGAMDVVVQSRPKTQTKDVPDQLGVNVIVSTLFGTKTYAEGADELVDVQIRSDGF